MLSSTSYKAKVGSNVRYELRDPSFRELLSDCTNSRASFDVLVFGTGCTFTLEGDGGFENVSFILSNNPSPWLITVQWAYIRQSACKADGKTITC